LRIAHSIAHGALMSLEGQDRDGAPVHRREQYRRRHL